MAETSKSQKQQLDSISQPIDKYLHLRKLLVTDAATYYQLLLRYTQQVLPYIYTPTVGEACQKYHLLPIQPEGVYLSLRDKGNVYEKLAGCNKPLTRVVVVTDGERVLGLGDLGANGMGICEGKIQLYTGAAGVDPNVCLPVCLDVGTNNASLLDDPHYKGMRRPRARGSEYLELVNEFVSALQKWRPHVLLQFEDFGNENAFSLLSLYRPRLCCFNDDIQGTAAICLAALLAACRLQGTALSQQRILFLGAGEAGTGIGELVAFCLHRRHGMPLTEARRRCCYLDSKGLVCASRKDLQHHKAPFAHDLPFVPDLKSAIRTIKPTALIGVSTIPNSFDQEVVELMCQYNKRPVIMPLSNPTSKSECTFEQAQTWSSGKVIFASGSPFPPLQQAVSGQTLHPAQANNAYIFPALGLAAITTQARSIPDDAFLVAAETLAGLSSVADMQQGHLFPPVSQLQQVSLEVAVALCEYFVHAGLGLRPDGCGDRQWRQYLAARMWGVPSRSAL